MRLKAHLGGFAIRSGERFIIGQPAGAFMAAMARGVWSNFIDFTGHSPLLGQDRRRPATCELLPDGGGTRWPS
ncbi:MAG: hypothetical protein Udaeo2_12640 [Candidatus Udaeobacter sp.]|nr:MAG: hypothetical protein Udaeo2_12640 [Candidatus Udaeobacter sp.]